MCVCVDDEVVAYYEAKGVAPPKTAASRRIKKGNINQTPLNTPNTPMHMPPPSPVSRRRRSRPPPRVLWQPLRPRLVSTLQSIPTNFQETPLATSATVLACLPFTPMATFFLPQILITDEILQRLYQSYGENLEEVVDDGRQMAKLAYVMARLSVRQTYRVVKRQVSGGAVISSSSSSIDDGSGGDASLR